ncbi:MAG: hypothetical protein PSX37_02365 [bacterium]|nr:hypothetical protein [bacterium]
MHYRISNEAGDFPVSVAVHNGVAESGFAFETWCFTVTGTTGSHAGRVLVIHDTVAGSAKDREDVAVRAAGLCLAAAPTAGQALVCFRDDPDGYQGMVAMSADDPAIDIPMTDHDIRELLFTGRAPAVPEDGSALPRARKEATWTRPSSRSSSSGTSRISFE